MSSQNQYTTFHTKSPSPSVVPGNTVFVLLTAILRLPVAFRGWQPNLGTNQLVEGEPGY